MTLQTEQLRRQRLEVLANEIDPLNEPVPSPRPYKEMMKAARKVYTYGAARQYPQFFDVPDQKVYDRFGTLEPRKLRPGRWRSFLPTNEMHCEHIAAYYRSELIRLQDSGVRFDAFNKLYKEYRKASRDAGYAATFWRA